MNRTPEACRSMSELRREIDALDRALVARLADRARYIDRAAELKVGEGLPARIESRVEDVVANVRHEAGAAGLDTELIETLWRQLIEWSIAREERVLGPSEMNGTDQTGAPAPRDPGTKEQDA